MIRAPLQEQGARPVEQPSLLTFFYLPGASLFASYWFKRPKLASYRWRCALFTYSFFRRSDDEDRATG